MVGSPLASLRGVVGDTPGCVARAEPSLHQWCAITHAPAAERAQRVSAICGRGQQSAVWFQRYFVGLLRARSR